MINANDYKTGDYMDEALDWMDDSDADHDVWQIVEEAASISVQAKKSPNDLHMAGRLYGMAEALRCMYNESCGIGYEPEQTQSWIEFIEGYAEANYEDGESID